MKTTGVLGVNNAYGERVRPVRVKSAGVFLIAVSLFLSGCAGEETPAPSSQATSASDAAERQSACLTERGWEVSIASDGAIQASVPDEQMDVYRQDIADCGEGLLPDPATFSDEQWSEMYAAVMDSADCLAEQGYEAADRPSLQLFIQIEGDWSPYSDIDTYDFERLESLCPQAEYWG